MSNNLNQSAVNPTIALLLVGAITVASLLGLAILGKVAYLDVQSQSQPAPAVSTPTPISDVAETSR